MHKHKKVDVAVKFFSREDPPKTVCLNLTNEVFRGGKSAVNGLMHGGKRGKCGVFCPFLARNTIFFAVMRHGIHEMGFAKKMSYVIQDYDLESSINRSEQGR